MRRLAGGEVRPSWGRSSARATRAQVMVMLCFRRQVLPHRRQRCRCRWCCCCCCRRASCVIDLIGDSQSVSRRCGDDDTPTSRGYSLLRRCLSLSLSLSVFPMVFLVSTQHGAAIRFMRWLRLRFDGCSTAYHRSLRAQWRCRSHAELFIYLCRSAAAHNMWAYGRNVGRRMVGRSAVESQSDRSCNQRLRRYRVQLITTAKEDTFLTLLVCLPTG